MPRVPINQLRINMSLRKQLFLLRESSVFSTRTGAPMLRVTLADRTGTLPGVFFDVPSYVVDSLAEGQGVEVTGRVNEYKDQLQVTLERIIPAELPDLEEFLTAAGRPLAEMKEELGELIASVHDPDLARLLSVVFENPDTYRNFTLAPAAKYNHHASVGGLLEHTLSVARITLTACELYPQMDRDLVVTVALLHDLGKILAYDPTSFALTEEGILWTHLYMSASQIERAIESLPGFNPELRLRVVHAILAHHGKLENGSPALPMTLEAIVLHGADHLDADAQGAIDHYARGAADDSPFTDNSYMHQSRLFRGRPAPGPKQERLW